MRNPLAAFALLTLALLATACGSSDDPAGPGLDSDADLLFTASTPANGNAHLDNPTVVYAANADASGLDRLTVTQTISGVTHTFYFYFNPTTGATHSAQHVWGPTGGIAQCVALACISANVQLDTTMRTAAFSELILGEDPVNGTAISTVSGTIVW